MTTQRDPLKNRKHGCHRMGIVLQKASVMRNRRDKCWARCTLTEWKGEWSRGEKNETPVLSGWPPLLLQTKSLRHFKWSGCWRHLWAEWMYRALNKIKQHSLFVFVYAHGNSNCSCQKYLFSKTAHTCALLLMWDTQFGFGENLSCLCVSLTNGLS